MTIRRQAGLIQSALLLVGLVSMVAFLALHFHDAHGEKPEDQVHLMEESGRVLLWIFIPLGSIILVWARGWRIKIERRFAAIMEQAASVDFRDPPVPLPLTAAWDELDHLAASLNEMRMGLHNSWEQMRVFTLQASHELKTPLAIIRADVERALREQADLPDERKAWMASSMEELDRLANLVDQLGYLTKADAGKLSLAKERVDAMPLVAAAAEDAEFLCAAAGLTLRQEELGEAVALGDALRIRQLLVNLLENAVRYNVPNGWVSLRLSQEGGEACLEVSNSSHALDAAEIPRVFDRFFRSENSKVKYPEGIGLGLSLVKWIAEEHGGSAVFENFPEAGGHVTRVTVKLPAWTADSN